MPDLCAARPEIRSIHAAARHAQAADTLSEMIRWPAASLVGCYELLVWLIRTSGALERESSAGRRCGNTACHAPARSNLAPTADSEQHGDGVSGADAVDDAAVAAYRLSVQAGNPLSERKLAQMFGRTSRRWARARITQARQPPQAPTPAVP
jgi:hypothetical protein